MADAHINPATGHWDDNYYANQGQYGGSSGDPNTDALNAKNNQYIDQLLKETNNNHQLALQKLDAQHKLAVGSNDDNTAKFLEGVANTYEAQNGRIPYDYQTFTNRENTGYGIQSGQINQTRQQALAQLAEDERKGNADIGLQQGQGNQSTAEDLNSRGLLSGMAPTGLTGGAPTTQQLGGVNGVGSFGALANNQGFANQRTALQNSIGLGQQQANLTANQGLQTLDFNHANTLTDLATNARRDTQDAQNNYQFGTGTENLLNTQNVNDLQRRRALLQAAAGPLGSTITGTTRGVLGYGS